MSMVFTRRPPTTTWRRREAFAACGAAFKRSHPVKRTPAAPAASLKNSRRLGMSKPPSDGNADSPQSIGQGLANVQPFLLPAGCFQRDAIFGTWRAVHLHPL